MRCEMHDAVLAEIACLDRVLGRERPDQRVDATEMAFDRAAFPARTDPEGGGGLQRGDPPIRAPAQRI